MPAIKKKRAPATDTNQRAWAQVYDDMNDVINSVNQKSAVESRNGASGGDGDIRLFKDVDRTKYFIEGKFKDGWAKRELLFSDLSNDTQDESINFSATEPYVKPDGSVPFTGVQTGISPSNANHLATRGYVDDLLATEDTLSELNDTTITSVANGNMLKYDTGTNTWINFVANFLPSYAVNDSYTGSSLNPTVFGLKQTGTSSITTVRGIRSANSNMAITLVESVSDGAYLNFNVASPTGITSVTGYDVGSGGYDSAITGNTSLKFNDDYDTGSSTGIFFEVTDSGNDTIVTPNIVGALTDTNYYADSLAFNTSNGVLTVGRAIVADLTVDLDGRYSTTDYNTVYTTSWVDSGDNAILRLTAGGSGSGNDDLTLVAGSNIYLTPSGTNMTIAANNTTSYALTNSASSGQQATLVTVNTGTAGKLRGFKQGSNITISSTDDGVDGDGYITIAANLSAATISTSYTNPLGGYLTQTTGNLRFVDNGKITWALAAQGGDITTVTPTIASYSASDVGAISTSHAAQSITSTHITVLGNTSGTNSGNVCTSNHTGAGYLTSSHTSNASAHHTKYTDANAVSAINATSSITTTCDSPDVNHNTDVNWNCSTISGSAGTARTTLGIDTNDAVTFGALTCSTLNTGNGAYELYKMDQNVDSESAVVFVTVNTGQGANELYDMNQNVLTSSDVRFDSFGVGTNASGTTGEIRATNEVTAYYSDDRLKTRRGNIKKALEKVCSLNGFHYSPNELAGSLGYDTSEKKVGVSAQEVLKVLPEAVTEAPIDPQYHAVQYDKLIPLLIEAVKELSERKCSCGV